MKILNRNQFIVENIKGLTAMEILTGLKSDTIKINYNGHTTFNNHFKFKDYLNLLIEGFNDVVNRYSKGPLKFMSDELISNKYNIGDKIDTSLYDYMYTPQCSNCGAYRLYLKLTGPKEVSFITLDSDNVCEVDSNAKSLDSEINVTSGELIFTNFFRDKRIYSPGKASINSIKGIKDLVNTLADLDVGYGQMSNMSVEVWKKQDGTEVLITDNYTYDENDYEVDFDYPGYIHLGSICMDIWRWMCADKDTLAKYDEEIPNIKKDSSVNMNSKEYINCDVIPGKWKIEHYFLFDENPKDGIYSKLYKM